MVANNVAVIAGPDRLTHAEACRIGRAARHNRHAPSVIVDLSQTREAETAAFAQLVLLRRDLLRHGRDLRLVGLHDQAARLYEINRLSDVLPRMPERA